MESSPGLSGKGNELFPWGRPGKSRVGEADATGAQQEDEAAPNDGNGIYAPKLAQLILTFASEKVMKGDLIKAALELGEAAFDAGTDDGIFKEIPLVGTVIALAKASNSVRDRMLLRKIARFFGPLSSISEAERESLLETLDIQQEFQARLTELSSIYLDRYDTEVKAEYLGILLVARLRGRIDNDHFFRMAALLDRAYWGDLDRLPEFYAAGSGGMVQSLSAVQIDGFVTASSLMLRDENDDENRFKAGFRITPLGKLFVELIDEFREEVRYRTEHDANQAEHAER